MPEREHPHLPEGWVVKPLVECTADHVISYGIVQPGSHQEGGIPIVRVNNFTGNGLDLSNVLRVEPSIEEKYSRTRLKGGEVLLTLVGSTGQSVVAPGSLNGWNVPRAVAVIRPAEKIGARWVNICLQSQATKNFLDVRANTTVQKTLNLKDVREIPIFVPPDSEKQFIESIIGSLDDKIELNRQMNATLEAMAQALFKSWFVDFDPVIDNALAAGHPIPEPLQARASARAALGDARKPLPDAIQRQFPNRFVFNDEMGWVPEGWGVSATEDVAEKIGMGPFGSNIKISTFVESGVPVISGKHLNKTLLTDEDFNHVTEEHAQRLKNSVVRSNDVIFTHAGNIGQVSLVPVGAAYSEYVISQRQFYLRPHSEKIPGSYFVYFFRSAAGQHKLLANASQVGVPSIARPSSHLKAIKVLVPSLGLLDRFNQECQSFFAGTMARQREVKALIQIRDTLLPKLLSGQLRVPEAERQVAEVL